MGIFGKKSLIYLNFFNDYDECIISEEKTFSGNSPLETDAFVKKYAKEVLENNDEISYIEFKGDYKDREIPICGTVRR